MVLERAAAGQVPQRGVGPQRIVYLSFLHLVIVVPSIYREPKVRDVLEDICRASRAPSTVSKYSRVFSGWQTWCLERGESALPGRHDSISRYLVNLHLTGAPFSRVESAFYSIKWHHDCSPLVSENPCNRSYLRCLLEGLRRIHAKPTTKKDPVSPECLLKIVLKFGMGQNLLHIRSCAIILLPFAGFLRNDELVNIRECDLEFHPGFVRIFIRKSKMDQLRDGAWVVVGETGSVSCPVKMLKQYMQLAESGNSSDFLFRPVRFFRSLQKHRLQAGQLSYSRCRELFKEALEGVGLDSARFGLHSLRAGGATAAARSGVPDRLFKRHGRWKSDGAKDGYVQDSLKSLLSVSLNLGL